MSVSIGSTTGAGAGAGGVGGSASATTGAGVTGATTAGVECDAHPASSRLTPMHTAPPALCIRVTLTPGSRVVKHTGRPLAGLRGSAQDAPQGRPPEQRKYGQGRE